MTPGVEEGRVEEGWVEEGWVEEGWVEEGWGEKGGVGSDDLRARTPVAVSVAETRTPATTDTIRRRTRSRRTRRTMSSVVNRAGGPSP